MATVANAGIPGSPVDRRIGAKQMTSPFAPSGGLATAISVTTSSQVFPLPKTGLGDDCVRLWNSGSTPVRVKFGLDNTVVATLADKAIPAGAIEIFRIGNAAFMAAIGAAAGTIEIDMGSGV